PSYSFAEGIEMLTGNNPDIAQSLLGTRVGRIKPGFKGDVITLDYNPATPLNEDTLGGHLLFGFHEDQVRNTVVDGEHIVENGHLKTVDQQKISRESRELAEDMWDRV
ncbi:MAG: chlorohydrolase, partial [bacterium]